ncbi:polyribonucleotide nucleotidyltransferase [Mongoliitalea daihaiensis]|uniref:polyribonucleotide nucleotidyltransferase n=1 Tax=Mongoliitalea daihaiensis TaxID=2782006 RepID=UPI001F338629|nr:polyribonucleotide nucleotidyltransferase [Mongoliitalea daihaiensis]UJP64084.1 polyribonucleotide nucleotidyltransferase [Mongoliitalea daihaiensis]
MLPNLITKSIVLEDGREIIIETGALAKQADGSVVVRMGNAMLLATVVSKKEAIDGVDFLPLSVDYQEKFAASGKIPGGFLKREGRLSDYEILISRIVDRAIRPIFPDDYHADTQIAITLMSADSDVLPDCLAGLAASAALAVSDIPFNGPISEVRVAKINGKLVINPTPAQTEVASLEFIVAGSMEYILMVEGEADEISEEEMVEALQFAHDEIKKHCQVQLELTKAVGKEMKRAYSHEKSDEALYEKMHAELYNKCYEVVQRQIANKSERSELIKAIKEGFIESLGEEHPYEASLIGPYFSKIHKEAARNLTLTEKKRLDGRALDEIRPIWSVVDYLPSAHGSAVFTRGETQSITTCTLGTKMDEQMVDGAMISGYNKFFLHYNFPGFSTGEVKPNRGPGRREVGHGNLAQRALKKVMPKDDENPYTIRIVSDILESNGSSSMATVCAGSLALMDAGVPIKAPVTGIAMGMISDAKTGQYSILSDILGDEDHLGDMDFKVTGTAKGITACQMDLKVEGLDYSVLKEALLQAKEGRLHILNEITKTLDTPRADLKPHAPRSFMMSIPKELIGAVIGPGGKVIQEIQKDTGATIVIEEKDNQGKISVFATNQTSMDGAIGRIKAIVAQPEIGETYTGKVKNIQPFGAFVEFMPGKDGLLHISEIKWERLETMDGVLEPGEEIMVKLIDVDKKTGKFKLSRKVLLPKPEKSDKKD